jgi:hypothetical protein
LSAKGRNINKMDASIPGHSVLPITADDVPVLGALLTSSKLQLVINRLLFKDWPNETVQLTNYTRAIQNGLSDPNTTSLKVTNDTTGDIVGHLGLTRHKTDNGESSRKGTPNAMAVPDGMVPDVFHAVVDAIGILNKDIENQDYMGKTDVAYQRPAAHLRQN